jgi:hypothetical protein
MQCGSAVAGPRSDQRREKSQFPLTRSRNPVASSISQPEDTATSPLSSPRSGQHRLSTSMAYVIDFLDFPAADVLQPKQGLKFKDAFALHVFCVSPKFGGLRRRSRGRRRAGAFEFSDQRLHLDAS